MAYETQPGTIPHRAVEHLKTLAAGTELSTAELAEALDVEPGTLIPCLAAPRKHGVLTIRKVEGERSMRWRLGDGTPEPLPPDYEPDQPLRGGQPPASPRPRAAAPLSAQEYVQRIGPEAPAKARSFDAWLSANGALLLQGVVLDDEGDAMLQPKDVAKLRQLLQGLATC